MKTENSYHYFLGREAMGLGKGRDSCTRLKGLSRVSWQQGWDDEASLRARRREKSPEQMAEDEETRAWFARELEAWNREMAGGI